MKRIAAALTAAVMMAALAGCGSSAQDKAGKQNTETQSADARAEKPAGKTEQKEAEPEELQVTDTGFIISSDGALLIGAEIKNPNKNYTLSYCNLDVTAQTADGKSVTADEQNRTGLGTVLPDSTVYWAGMISGNKNIADTDTVSVTPVYTSDCWIRTDTEADRDLYTVSDVSVQYTDAGCLVISGKIALKDEQLLHSDVPDPAHPNLVCILRDKEGKIVTGFSFRLPEALEAGPSVSFSDRIWLHTDLDYASADVYAYPG